MRDPRPGWEGRASGDGMTGPLTWGGTTGRASLVLGRGHPGERGFSPQLHLGLCSKFDLYTKSPDLPEVDKLRPYYQGLIDKYCPGVLCW